MTDQWEMVIGLEIHVELNTQSKLFSSAPNRFGDRPNENITEVCTGQPGALPVLNQEAVRKAAQFGCAIGATVSPYSKFDRKSYFYPDSPRNFQITQLDHPIVVGGTITTEVEGREMTFYVNRAHLEDDAGMLKHFPGYAGVDYNRAGVPLIEIVSEPCIHSPKQASAYAMAIKAILEYIDVSDCNMEEGSLRFDANISVRRRGETHLRNKVEIKNMNSFMFLEMAIEAEAKRQIKKYRAEGDGPHVISPATYRWDGEKKENILMRKKESAEDYRYFPEPDLVPVVLSEAYIEEVRSQLPELPRARKERYIRELGLSDYAAATLTSSKQLADFFEAGLAHTSHARSLCNWMTVELAGRLKEKGVNLTDSQIPPAHIAYLVEAIEEGTVTGKIGKKIASEMVAAPEKDPREMIRSNPAYRPMSDTSAIEAMVDAVIANHAPSVEDYRAGKKKAFGFLMGQIMQASQGAAPPQVVTALLKKKLED